MKSDRKTMESSILTEPLEMKEQCYLGRLLVFTGNDGTGKSTMLEYAKAELSQSGQDIFELAMPSQEIRSMKLFRDFHDAPTEVIRSHEMRLALTLIASGDRLRTLHLSVIPELKRGSWVLCDRYAYTGLVRCTDNYIRGITECFLKPDAVFLTHCPAEVCEQRIRQRPSEKDRFFDHAEEQDLMHKYKVLAQANDFCQIDTTNPVERCFQQVKSKLLEL